MVRDVVLLKKINKTASQTVGGAILLKKSIKCASNGPRRSFIKKINKIASQTVGDAILLKKNQ